MRSLAPRPPWKGMPSPLRLSVGSEYMRLPPGGGSAIGGGGECVCEIRNGGASSASFLPRSPSVTLRAPPALRNATNEKPPLGCFSKSCMPSQREARIPQPLGNRRCIFGIQQRRKGGALSFARTTQLTKNLPYRSILGVSYGPLPYD